eukprot:UN12550
MRQHRLQIFYRFYSNIQFLYLNNLLAFHITSMSWYFILPSILFNYQCKIKSR